MFITVFPFEHSIEIPVHNHGNGQQRERAERALDFR